MMVMMEEENRNLQQVNSCKASTEKSGICCFIGLGEFGI